MAKKLVAVFLTLVVVVAALHVRKAEAEETIEEAKQFVECEKTCLEECEAENNTNTRCEMKCDTECEEKESAGN